MDKPECDDTTGFQNLPDPATRTPGFGYSCLQCGAGATVRRKLAFLPWRSRNYWDMVPPRPAGSGGVPVSLSLPMPGEVQVLRLRPGDVLAVITSRRVTQQEAAAIKTRLAAVWPNNKSVVLEADHVAVLRAKDVNERDD